QMELDARTFLERGLAHFPDNFSRNLMLILLFLLALEFKRYYDPHVPAKSKVRQKRAHRMAETQPWVWIIVGIIAVIALVVSIGNFIHNRISPKAEEYQRAQEALATYE